jgi:integrase/recombinase XerD
VRDALEVSVTTATYVHSHGVLGPSDDLSPHRTGKCWAVVDDRYVEHRQVGEYLQVIVDGQGRSVGTARTYAGRLALYLTWPTGIEPFSQTVAQLASFARWIEHTRSRKHRLSQNRRRAADPKLFSLEASRPPTTLDGILAAVVEFARFATSRWWGEPRAAGGLSTPVELRFLPPRFHRPDLLDQKDRDE